MLKNRAFILALVNTVIVLGAVGMLVYTKLIFKRPKITESGERERLATVHEKPTDLLENRGYVDFEPITVNIAATPVQPRPGEGAEQIKGKLHYVHFGFALELRDDARREEITPIKAIFMDRLLALLGRKTFYELITVQGRYLLRQEMIGLCNQVLVGNREGTSKNEVSNALVTNVFFTQFVVQ